MSAISNLRCHIVWCTKYRRDMLKGDVEIRLRELLEEKCNHNGYDIIALEIMPDHVHIFVTWEPTEPLHRVVNQLKGYTARRLKQEFKQFLTRVPNVWTRSYYIGSVGDVSSETVKKYIENQKNV